MAHECVEGLLFVFFKEAAVLIAELSNNLGEEIERVRLVMFVFVHTCNRFNNLFQDGWLRQNCKETFIFAEVC